MGINLNEISQKVLDNNTNASNVFRKMYDLHYNPNPLDVPFEYIDENGNKTTTNIANIANFREKVWDDVGGALGQFNRTFYVDSDNGDDNNDGSSGSPFATLGKAVNSVPIGGYGKIIFISGTDDNNRKSYTLTSINVGDYNGKSIYIDFGSYTDIYFKVNNDDNASTAYTTVFNLNNSDLIFRVRTTAQLHLVDKPDGMDWSYLGRTRVVNISYGSTFNISGYNHNSDTPTVIVEGTDNSPYFLGTCIRDQMGISATMGLYLLYMKFNNNDFIKVLNLYSTTANVSIYDIGFKDGDGNDVAFEDTIDGVVYDGDSGNPVNFVSNYNISN